MTSVEGNDTIHSIEMFFATKFDDVIYGDENDTKKNQITVSFKNMNNTSEHIVVKDIRLLPIK